MKFKSFDEWIKDNSWASEIVECDACGGTGECDCCDCGSKHICGKCDGDGNVDKARELYEEQVRVDKKRLEKTGLVA